MKILIIATHFLFLGFVQPGNTTGNVETWEPIKQIFDGAECPGDVFTFRANVHPTSGTYFWEVFNGASIISGQGTSMVRVQSPSNSGFRIDLTVNGTRHSDLAEYGICQGSGGPGGGGPGGGGSPGGGTPIPSSDN